MIDRGVNDQCRQLVEAGLDEVCGKGVEEALTTLDLSPKRFAKPLAKLVRESARAVTAGAACRRPRWAPIRSPNSASGWRGFEDSTDS